MGESPKDANARQAKQEEYWQWEEKTTEQDLFSAATIERNLMRASEELANHNDSGEGSFLTMIIGVGRDPSVDKLVWLPPVALSIRKLFPSIRSRHVWCRRASSAPSWRLINQPCLRKIRTGTGKRNPTCFRLKLPSIASWNKLKSTHRSRRITGSGMHRTMYSLELPLNDHWCSNRSDERMMPTGRGVKGMKLNILLPMRLVVRLLLLMSSRNSRLRTGFGRGFELSFEKS